MLIDEIMTPQPASVGLGTSVRWAAELLAASGAGMLMVLDTAGAFVGVLTETDLLTGVLPDGDEIRAAGNTLDAAFDAFVTKGATVADGPIDDLVVRDAVTIARGVPVAAAAVVLVDRGLRRIPVLEGSRVVGAVSRTDLCRAVLARAEGGAANGPASPAAPAAATPVPPTATRAASAAPAVRARGTAATRRAAATAAAAQAAKVGAGSRASATEAGAPGRAQRPVTAAAVAAARLAASRTGGGRA